MEFLKVENLCKIYGRGENQVTALDNVSLTIENGEFVAIIGSSGSGKSTLLHAIAGVDVPTSGKIYISYSFPPEYCAFPLPITPLNPIIEQYIYR